LIKQLKALFTDHPSQVGETYFSHQQFAMGMGFTLLCVGSLLIIHSIFPFIFKNAGSLGIMRAHEKMMSREKIRDDWW